MMKKNLFFGMFAVATMLFAASCTEDDLTSGGNGNEATISFNLRVENGVQTRAISDGKGANTLIYEVYSVNDLTTPLPVFENDATQKTETVANLHEGKHTVTIALAKGQSYKVVFWAQNSAATDVYDTKILNDVKVNYQGANNDDTRDAFYNTVNVDVVGHADMDVTLNRPFAQLNVGVFNTDWSAAIASGIEIGTSKAVIKNAATNINLITGAVSGQEDVTYDFAAIPTEELMVDLHNDGTKEAYKYLSMSYILANDASGGANKATLQDLIYTFRVKENTTGNDIVFEEGLNNVPVQRNWRTNIVGQILTGNVHFTIKIDPAYDSDYVFPVFEDIYDENGNPVGVSYDASTKTYGIKTADGLLWANDNLFANIPTEGSSFRLLADIEMKDKVWNTKVASHKNFIFDGNGYTISNWSTTGCALFAPAGGGNITIKNLTLDKCAVNCSIAGWYGAAGLIVGAIESGHLTVENCKVTASAISSKSYAAVWIGYSSKNFTALNCAVEGTTITGENAAGAFAGATTSNTTITNAVVTGCTITGKGYVEGNSTIPDEDMAGILAGSIQGVATITTSDVTTKNKVLSTENSEKIYGRIVGGTLDLNGLIIKEDASSYPNPPVYTYEIPTAQALAFASEWAFKNGGTYTITDNINMLGVKYTPAKVDKPLTINGGDYTISNLEVIGGNSAALIGEVNNTLSISKLTIDKAHFAADNNKDGQYTTGAFAGWVQAAVTLDECNATNVTYGSSKYVGGLVGYQTNVAMTITECLVENCNFTSEYTENGTLFKGHAGGLIGLFTSGTLKDSTVKNCMLTVKREGSATEEYRYGAAVGTMHNTAFFDGVTVDNVTINGKKATASELVGNDSRTDKESGFTVK